MSNLLEQAIIDANALRETALNSAKSALIDKYKDEFEESMKKLLEQEEPEIPQEQEENPLDTSMDLQDDASKEEPGGESFKEIPSSFLDGDDEELITIDFDNIEKQLKDTLSSSILASPEQDADMSADMSVPQQETPQDQTQQTVGTQALEENIELEESNELEEEFELEESNELEEEFELEESEEIEEVYKDDQSDALYAEDLDVVEETAVDTSAIDGKIAQTKAQLAQLEKDKAQKQMAAAAQKEQPLEQPEQKTSSDLELSEEEILELEDAQNETHSEDVIDESPDELTEEMFVDIDVSNLMSGHMGASSRKKEELRNLELAAARDSYEEEERKKQEEEISDLKEKLEESFKQNNKYLKLIEDLKENLNILKEHTEKLSVSNAKLLYINKVFGNSSLNERQKEHIVESISRSQTVLEAKTIYDTLQSTVQGVVASKHKESLSEALNRGSSSYISRPKQSSLDDNSTERMKILAGIKNN